MSDITLDARPRRQTIGKLPVNLFAAVMGVSGLSLAWREAGKVFEVPTAPGEALGWIAVAIYVAMASGYLAKLMRHPDKVAAEFSHPVMGNFFAMMTVATMLLSGFLRPYAPILSQGMWLLGAGGALVVAYVMIRRFLTRREDLATSLPPILLPPVAIIDIPATGAGMPFSFAHELNLLGLGAGGMLVIVFLALVFARLRHQEPMPLAMRPSFMILVAPFAVGFLAYTNVTGDFGPMAAALFYSGLALFLLVAPQVFRREVPFSIGWWGISFPLAALSIAALRYAAAVGGVGLSFLAGAIFLFLAVAILVLLARTLVILLNGSLLRAET